MSTESLSTRLEVFLLRTYVQQADARQRSMGLSYMTAGTSELARTLSLWFLQNCEFVPAAEVMERSVLHADVRLLPGGQAADVGTTLYVRK